MLFLCNVRHKKLEKLEKLENWKTRLQKKLEKLQFYPTHIFKKLKNYFLAGRFSYENASSFLEYVEY